VRKKELYGREFDNSDDESEGRGGDRKDRSEVYRRPLYDEIKIIDFGGATFADESHSQVINTRQYRAPEVILGKSG